MEPSCHISSPFSSASLPSSRSGHSFCPSLSSFPGGFSDYIRHTWQHSILLNQTSNMNCAPSQRERAYQVFQFCISLQNVFISYFGHQFTCTYNIKRYDRASCDIYVVLSAGQRACKDRAVPRLRSISDRA